MVSLYRRPSSIEPLESRIAPALLINGANLLVAGSANSVGETSVGDNSAEVVKVTSGQAIVWFKDGDILGISFGPNTSLEITGSVLGDIVGNLTSEGRLSDFDRDPSNGEDGAVLLANNLIGLKLKPFNGVTAEMGNIITGGAVSNVKIDGTISGIYAGDGAFQEGSDVAADSVVSSSIGDLDFNPIQAGSQSVFVMPLEFAKTNSETGQKGLLAGASIQNIQIGKAREFQMFAGSGNPNSLTFAGKAPTGGSIRNILIDTAFSDSELTEDPAPSYHIRAGSGGSGGVGGAGGLIDNIIEKAASGKVRLEAGHGGTGSAGAGGNGGSISNLDLQSDSSQYTVIAGNGGTGTPGGAGGSVRNTNFTNRTPLGGVIVAADFNNDGYDDVLVADQGTGRMVLNANIGDGTNFEKVVQFFDDGGNPVYFIGAKGSTPSDAKAVDFDGDNDLDLVVSYKNSNSVAVYLNQGNGSFWDASIGEKGDFAGFSVGLGISPTKLAVLDGNGGRIAVVGLLNGKGAAQLLKKQVKEGDNSLAVLPGVNEFTLPVVDIVGPVNGGLFIATGDGKIEQLEVSGLEKQPFNVSSTGYSVIGGIADLDIDSSGDRLLALGQNGKVLNVYEIQSGATDSVLSAPVVINLQDTPGRALVAKFVDSGVDGSEDRIAVLNSLPNSARISVFQPLPTDDDPNTEDQIGYVAERVLDTTQTLKTFVPAYSKGSSASFAALAGSLSQFTFGKEFITTAEYALPFASKSVNAFGGNGGNGVNLGAKLGKGGAGGSIIGLNADAHEITLEAGDGGNGQGGAGGAGGSISNPKSFKSAGGANVSPTLLSDAILSITAGNGGSVLDASNKKAFGGSGGSISSLTFDFALGNEIRLFAGTGGDGRGGAGGVGGSIKTIKGIAHGGDFLAVAGNGGEALAGANSTSGIGGAGGSIIDLSHATELEGEEEAVEEPVAITLTAGSGGKSLTAAGGAGGSLVKIALNIDAPHQTFNDPAANPPRVDAHRDSTVEIQLTAGVGADGTKGGSGGSINGLKYDSVLDQEYKGGVFLNYYVMTLTAGSGGRGTQGNGGDGGSILLNSPISGITSYDPDSSTPFDTPLVVTAGNGGEGTARGGIGGAVSGLVAQNSPFFTGAVLDETHLFGAKVTAGNGGNGGSGDGGRGGNVNGGLIGVQGGYLQISAGKGGSTPQAKGGAGGSVTGGEFGSVTTFFNAGIVITGGNGGNGLLAGGAGGAVASVRMNTSQSTEVPSAMIIAGSGGDANSTRGAGGKGGDIAGITQAKDVNSSLNLLQAGNGGDNLLGKGGIGGSVSKIRTVGFIGRPSASSTPLGIFDEVETGFGAAIPTELFHDTGNGSVEFAQGLFVGRGGQSGGGQPAAINGSVKDIVARQIAAISAAMDPATRLFAAVEKISKVKTDLIGYDADRGLENSGSGKFNDSLGGSASPTTVIPKDGFLLTKSPLTPAQKIVIKLQRDNFLLS